MHLAVVDMDLPSRQLHRALSIHCRPVRRTRRKVILLMGARDARSAGLRHAGGQPLASRSFHLHDVRASAIRSLPEFINLVDLAR